MQNSKITQKTTQDFYKIKKKKKECKEEEERRIQEMKAEMKKLKKTEQRRGSREDEVRVELPKVVISQFEGTHLDWFRFWNQYET